MTAAYRRFLAASSENGVHSQWASSTANLPVLVTGAGGYIGSALVKAIAAAGPSRIILLDSSEQNLFDIHQDLNAAFARVPHEAVLGSVTDAGLLQALFDRFRPAFVYHAAAVKHVSLLELNPSAAVRVNAIGTYTLLQAALHAGGSTVVLVSTDKAVNPHSIMGASKRLAELIVAALSGPHCPMHAVRLGNVIGSTGSVVPIFLRQISHGGPVTVTHPEAERYFISLPGAVDAILAAGAADCAGCVMLPDLGEPVPIAGLARFLIHSANRASEVPIRFIGLRPGEKLTEDLISQTETRDASAGGPLQVIRNSCPPPAELRDRIDQIGCRLARGEVEALLELVIALVPEYRPSSIVRGARA
jgi:FlaA1/EpsC-like NDP-sugar epimerase